MTRVHNIDSLNSTQVADVFEASVLPSTRPESRPNNEPLFCSSMRSQRTSLDPRTTGSSLIRDLKSRDTHLGVIMREVSSTRAQIKKEKRFATLYDGFKTSKQFDRQEKQRFRDYKRALDAE